MIPHWVLAAGWIPFVVFLVLALLFSTLYVLWYRSVLSSESSLSASLAAIFTLTITLLTSALVPVDVFLVSFMKFNNGTFKPWAEEEETRTELENTVLYAYYSCYGVILLLAFLVLPLMFFFHVGSGRSVEDEEEEETCSKKMWRAAKYTSLLIMFFVLLVIAGCFIPIEDVEPPNNATSWHKMGLLFEQVKVEHGEGVMVFVLNVLNVIGMAFLILYTGYGLSVLPLGMILGGNVLNVQRQSVETEIENLESEIREIRSRHDGGDVPHFEVTRLERLERQVRLLQRSRHALEQSARSCINRLLSALRPFQLVFGILAGLLTVLVFVSLLLTSADKAINSLGPMHGYVVVNGTLPNPIDILLVLAQEVFPLDYILYCAMILFFVFCSLSGIKDLGIRFFWLNLYQIRPSRTPPQALVLLCLILIYVLMALNVLMFSLVPDYTTYGSQYHVVNATVGNSTVAHVERCNDLESQAAGCEMTRIAYLLLAFHSKVWIFGALYYWLIWAFLTVMLIGSGVAFWRLRRPTFVLDDEEELLDESNPFNT